MTEQPPRALPVRVRRHPDGIAMDDLFRSEPAPDHPLADAGAPPRRHPPADAGLVERPGPAAPGRLAVLTGTAALGSAAALLWRARPLRAAHLLPWEWAALAVLGGLAVVCFGGLTRGRTGSAWVLSLFGRYRGSVRRTGLTWISPFVLRRRVDVRLRHWRSEPIAAVDAEGSALRVVVLVVWSVRDTARALYAVDDHLGYLREQVEAAPVESYVFTGVYGERGAWSRGYHTGQDFAVPSGTPVRAVGPGRVVRAGYAGAYGYEVVLRHPDGRYTQYAHLSRIDVSAGQSVPGPPSART
ncbi:MULTISPECIES: peptidoglycan DD-metalloendopeptidase family protein [unclassified Streptomyces]|uniref:peptidoglycan DD-metalloendopeptidase family protein n=1 Tax=unclassified Streptomyces TaxID=2593676 RepID=UPI001F0F8A5F|nr:MULTISPECIES: peptidoglycan DD-metalloendopeptidase family protein [unclassified Streptomyces]